VTLTYSTKDIKPLKLGSFISAIGRLGRTLRKENEKHNQSFFQDRSSSPTQDEVNSYKAWKNPARPNKCISQPADEVPESTDIVVLRSEQNGIENLKRIFEYGIENLKNISKRSISVIIVSAIALFGSLLVESLLTGFIMCPLGLYLISNTMDIGSAAFTNAFPPRDTDENKVALAKQNKSATIALTTTASIFLIIFLIITSGNMPDISNLSGIFGMLLGGLFLAMN